MSSSSQDRSQLNQDTFSDRDEFSLRHEQVFESNVPFIRFSNPANVAKSLLDGKRDHLLAEARSELVLQEYKVEPLNNFISELQQQAHAQSICSGKLSHVPVNQQSFQVPSRDKRYIKIV